VLERAVLLGKNEVVTAADLPPVLSGREGPEISLDEALGKRYTLREVEQEYIRKVLQFSGGNKTEAAQILGVDRTTLYRKLEEMKGRG
jgi:DNA-binding NtrC family response regulator